MADNMNTV